MQGVTFEPWTMATTERDSDSKKKRKLAVKEASKDVSWNVPDCVFLEPTQLLTVGRSAAADVLMHSRKHPYMLSRRHATLKFDSSSQQWTIEDLKVLYTPSNPISGHSGFPPHSIHSLFFFFSFTEFERCLH